MASKPYREFTKQVAVRLDDELLAALAEDAAANGRTVAQSVRFHLRRALAGDLARG